MKKSVKGKKRVGATRGGGAKKRGGTRKGTAAKRPSLESMAPQAWMTLVEEVEVVGRVPPAPEIGFTRG